MSLEGVIELRLGRDEGLLSLRDLLTAGVLLLVLLELRGQHGRCSGLSLLTGVERGDEERLDWWWSNAEEHCR